METTLLYIKTILVFIKSSKVLENNSRHSCTLFFIYSMNKIKNRTKVWEKKPYLNTTASKLVENTKAFELTIIKELGKLTP